MATARYRRVLALVVVLAACTGTSSSSRDDAGTVPPRGTSAVTSAPSTASTQAPATASTAPPFATTTVLVRCRTSPETCSLSQLAGAYGVRFGAAVGVPQLQRPEIAAVVSSQFAAITPENEMKWSNLEPAAGAYNFAPADEVVDFARRNGLQVRGHTLVWGQQVGNGLPGWVSSVNDPNELRGHLERMVDTVVTRYSPVIRRWDVVNEPLANPGSTLDDNHFRRVLGDDYMAIAFRSARAADATAELWLNEVDAAVYPQRGDALVALVSQLISEGVPIDGVGLQGHFRSGSVPDNGYLGQLIGRLRALGVRVAITELDLPLRTDLGDGPEALAYQASQYGQVVRECVAAGCEEITVWGVSDRDSWLNSVLQRSARPLLFDDAANPKPAYDALREAFSAP